MGRGFKVCKACGKSVGPRSFACRHCGALFAAKEKVVATKERKRRKRKKSEKLPHVSWHELQKGDYIKSIQGYGPYWPSQEGENIYVGHYGKFKVSGVTEDGILAYECVSGGTGGFCFIYMGKQKEAKSGTILVAHKIKRFKHKERGSD